MQLLIWSTSSDVAERATQKNLGAAKNIFQIVTVLDDVWQRRLFYSTTPRENRPSSFAVSFEKFKNKQKAPSISTGPLLNGSESDSSEFQISGQTNVSSVVSKSDEGTGYNSGGWDLRRRGWFSWHALSSAAPTDRSPPRRLNDWRPQMKWMRAV